MHIGSLLSCFIDSNFLCSPTSKRLKHQYDLLFNYEGIQKKAKKTDTDEIDRIKNHRDQQQRFIQKVISKVDVFSFITVPVLNDIVRGVEILEFQPGDMLFEEDQYNGNLMIVASGTVLLTTQNGTNEPFKIPLHDSDCITSLLTLACALIDEVSINKETSKNDTTLLDRAMKGSSARAVHKVVLLQFKRSLFRKIFEDFFKDFRHIIQVIIQRTLRVTIQSLVVYFGMVERMFVHSPFYTLTTNTEIVSDEVDGDFREVLFTHLPCILESMGTCMDEFKQMNSIEDDVELVELCESDVFLFNTNEHCNDIYFVIKGEVTVSVYLSENEIYKYEATAGFEIGMLSAFAGDQSLMEAKVNIWNENHSKMATLVRIPCSTFLRLLQIPNVLLCCAKYVISQFSELVFLLDNSFEWIHLNSGEQLFAAGDLCTDVFRLMNGRLRSIKEHVSNGGQTKKTIKEVGKGGILGAMTLLASSRHHTTSFAIRDSQVARLPQHVFEYVVATSPSLLRHFTQRVLTTQPQFSRKCAAKHRYHSSIVSLFINIINALQFVVAHHLLGATGNVPTSQFAQELKLALLGLDEHCGSKVVCVNANKLVKELGSKIFNGESKLEKIQLSSWLADLEISNHFVIYECKYDDNDVWTSICLRQADHILVVCGNYHVNHRHDLSGETKAMLEDAWQLKDVAISLVHLNKKTDEDDCEKLQRYEKCSKTVMKREEFAWLSFSHNIRVPFSSFQQDMNRLARRLAGRSIGLVLGGGGARGLAHIGVLQALEEANINIDIIGGTSIGSFVAGLYAQNPGNWSAMFKQIEPFSKSMGSVSEKIWDLTLPIASFFTGQSFSRSIQSIFGSTRIEDLVLNYFCISTDISKKRMGVHTSGELWKFVRASMSLQGYLPPICNEDSLLLDGGYMNNLPADIMKESGADIIIAVDVGQESRTEYFNYGNSLSGWWLLWNKLNPFAETVKVPSMGDISAALAYVSSEQHKNNVKYKYVDLYLRPPINKYGTLEFDKYLEIIQLGYDYAKPIIKEWLEQNKKSLPTVIHTPSNFNSLNMKNRSHVLSPLSLKKRPSL